MVVKPSKEFLQEALTNNSFDIDSTDKAIRMTLDHSFSYLYRLQRNMLCYEEFFYTSRNEVEQPDYGDYYMDPRERICINLPASLILPQQRERFRTSKYYKKPIGYETLCTNHTLFARMPIITVDNRVLRRFDLTIYDDFFTAHLPFDRYFLHTKVFNNRRWEYEFVEHKTSLQVINNSSFIDVPTNTGMLKMNSYNKTGYDRLLRSYLTDLGIDLKKSEKGTFLAVIFFGDELLGTQLQEVRFDSDNNPVIMYDYDVLTALQKYSGPITIRFYFYKFLKAYRRFRENDGPEKLIQTRIRDSELTSELFIIQNPNRETKKNYLLPIPTENLLVFRVDDTKCYGDGMIGSGIHYPNKNVDIRYPNIYRIHQNISMGDQFKIFYFYMPPYDLQYEHMYWFMYNYITYKWSDASLEETVNRIFFREMVYDQVPGFQNEIGDMRIQAYTGVSDPKYKPEYIIDTDTDTEFTETRWESGVPMKVGGFTKLDGDIILGERIEDAVSYIVIDTGRYMLHHLSEIKIQWDNFSYATEYKVQVSDTCRKSGDVGDEVTTNDLKNEIDVWEDVATVSRRNGDTEPYKTDIISGDDLHHKYLRRYVRILITRLNLASQTAHPAIREVSFQYDMELSSVNIIWTFDHIKRCGNRPVIMPDLAPSYGSEFSTPYAEKGEPYYVKCDFGNWEYRDIDSSTWKPVDSIHFDFNRYYRATFIVRSFEKLFSNDLIIQINGSRDNVAYTRNNDRELVITYTFEPLTDYREFYMNLRNWFSSSAGVAIIDRFKLGQDEATERTWEDFIEIYYYFAEYVCRMLNTEEVVDSLEAPRYYRYDDLVSLKRELVQKYEALSCTDAATLRFQEPVNITVPEPIVGGVSKDATINVSGELSCYPESDLVVRDETANTYSVDKNGIISGYFAFNNDDPFKILGNTEFIISMRIMIMNDGSDRQRVTIMGKKPNKFMLELQSGKLVWAGRLSGGWHRVDFDIPDDEWYKTWHDIFCLYNGSKFEMYVDGEAAYESPGYESRSGSLPGYSNSLFTWGYSWENKSEQFTGSIKDFRMIADNRDLPFPDWRSLISHAEVPREINKALVNMMELTPNNVRIYGLPTKYDITETRWTPSDPVIKPNTKYTVEVDIETLPYNGNDYRFRMDDISSFVRVNDLLIPTDNISLSNHGGKVTIRASFNSAEEIVAEIPPHTKIESFEDVFNFVMDHEIVDYRYDEVDYLRKYEHLHPFEYKVMKLKEFIKDDWEALHNYVLAQNKVGIKYEFSAEKINLESRYCVQMETGDPLPEPMYLFPIEKPNPNRILSARVFIDGLMCSTFVYDRYEFTDMIYIPVSQVQKDSYFEIEVFPSYTEKHLVNFTEDKPYVELSYPSTKAIAPTMSDMYFYFGEEDDLNRIEKTKFNIEVISSEYNYYVDPNEITIYYKTNKDGNPVKGPYYDEDGHCYSFEGQPLHEKDLSVEELSVQIRDGNLSEATGWKTDDHFPVIRATDIVTFDRVALGEPIHLPNDKGIIYSWITKIRITVEDSNLYNKPITVGISKEPAFRSGRVSAIEYPYYVTSIENTQDAEEYTRVFKNGRILSKNRYDFTTIDGFLGIQVLDQLRKGDTIAFDITPYRNRLVMYKRVLTSDLVDLRGYINKPFDLRYYEVYLNGRRLNKRNIYPISPWEFKLARTHSVYHLEIYEKDRDWEYYGIDDWKYITLSDFIRRPFVEPDIADKLIEDLTGKLPDADNTEEPTDWDRVSDIISVYFEMFYYMKLVPMHFVSGDKLDFETNDIEKRFPIVYRLFHEINKIGENVLLLNPNVAYNPETTTPDKDGHEPWNVFMLGNPTLEGLDDEDEWKGADDQQ